MSDSPLSDAAPDDNVLELELRQVVRGTHAKGNLEELTVKRVRAATEKNLGLKDGFFKEQRWKDMSKTIIEDEATRASNDTEDKSSPARPKSSPLKRASSDSPQSSKRQKVSKREEVAAAESRNESSEGEKPRRKTRPKLGNGKTLKSARPQTAKARKHGVSASESDEVEAGITESASKEEPPESELSDVIDEDPNSKKQKGESKAGRPNSKGSAVQDESTLSELSELSDVLDEDPKLKKRKGKADSQKSKASQGEAKKRGRKKKEKPTDMDPDAEEIKRLQGWLIKCGIRKMWGRELKDCDTAKAKIRHLKEMLAEAGMTGRFSIEKARQIRETRELQADLMAVQEGAKRWGNSDGQEEETQPRRRLARGLEGLDFSDEDSD